MKVHDQALSGEEVLGNFNAGKGSWQPSISIDDVTVTEGVDTPTFIDDFIPAGSDRTLAEMDADEKNAISHRGRALRRVMEAARSVYGVAG